MSKLDDQNKRKRFQKFIAYFNEHITGDEKGEGQLFFENLLQAFGNAGVRQVGAVCENRVKKKSGRTGFADLVWRPRVVVELKKRGEKLEKHYEQAFEYWLTLVPNRPKYMVLCNFDEFWIYDLNNQLNDPVHKLDIQSLPENWGSLGFLFPKAEKPIFDNHNIEVTKEVAKEVGRLYFSMVDRGIDSNRAQRFVLQLVVALFSEDIGLLPKYALQRLLKSATLDPVLQAELTNLFKAMSEESPTKKPKGYENIQYFNGDIFNNVEPVELNYEELDMLVEAANQNWTRVRPSIFGSIFEGSMDQEERHGHGIHYTSELDIQKIINPTIVKPFRKKIEAAKKNKAELGAILNEIENFKVLDPSCGSGNFLYLAFRELRRLEIEVLEKIDKNFNPKQMRMNLISPKNFYGIDTNKFGIELAKIALSIGRKLSADEFGIADNVLPFEALEENFIPKDALFTDWPPADVIVGNPPYLSSRYMKVEYPVEYVNAVRKQFKDVPGRADYCVYWFRKAHDSLKYGQRAGLVGTNTIRQNYSRIGGLDYITNNDGTIIEAVSTQVWSGAANVHVSIVNWIKGKSENEKKLFTQSGDRFDSPWVVEELQRIPPTLSSAFDATQAKIIEANKLPKKCFVGQAPQSKGFYLTHKQYQELKTRDASNKEVLFPFLIGRELLSKERASKRYVIDFQQMDIFSAQKYKNVFKVIENSVLADVQKKAKKELEKYGKPKSWNNHLKNWWHHWRNRSDLISEINKLTRYIVVSRVTKRPIFEFVSPLIHPGDALNAFTFEDDYSFGILQSSLHTEWFKAKCSTLKGDWRYTADSIFDTFCWPQNADESDVQRVAEASRNLRALRAKVMTQNDWGLKELYKTLDTPGDNPLKNAQSELDHAVLQAYSIDNKQNELEFLLRLNKETSEKADQGEKVIPPGLPPSIITPGSFVSEDCIQPPENY